MQRFQPSHASRAYAGDGTFDLIDAAKVIGVGTVLFVVVFGMALFRKD